VKPKPLLSAQILWDIEPSSLNFEESPDWVIERVFDRGSLEEVMQVVKYYGHEYVKQFLLSTPRRLPNHSILLAKAIFSVSFSDFLCLKKNPFLPGY
jgi:hypothetical protein